MDNDKLEETHPVGAYNATGAEPGEADRQAGAEPEARSLTDILYGVISRPVETLRFVTETKPVAVGVLIYVLIALVDAVVSIPGNTMNFRSFAPQLQGLPQPDPSAIVTLSVIVSPFLALIWLLMLTGIYHLLATAFKGEGTYSGLISALGFANFPKLLIAPFALLTLALSSGGQTLYSLARVGIWLWAAALVVLAIRENYRISTGRAVWTFLIPLAVSIVLVTVLVVLLVAFLVGTMGTGVLQNP